MSRKRRTQTVTYSAANLLPEVSPGLVAGAVMTLLALLLLAGPALRRIWSARFSPRISFQTGGVKPQATAAEKARPEAAAVFEGEVSRTEVRLREAGAVATGAVLTGLALAMEKRPAREAGTLLAGMQQRGLLPPGVRLTPEGELAGVYGVLQLRWRAAPFGVEVLSLGRERRDGPALLLRVPETAATETGASPTPTRYYHALTLSQVKVPPPFAAPTAILAHGWAAATLKPQTPAEADAAQLVTWAQTLAAQNEGTR